MLAFKHARPHMMPLTQLRRREFPQPMGATISRVFARRACHIYLEHLSSFLKEKMEISMGTVFHDVFGDGKLFMLDNFNEKFLDFVEVSSVSH